jgi:hypothetical protein
MDRGITIIDVMLVVEKVVEDARKEFLMKPSHPCKSVSRLSLDILNSLNQAMLSL